MHLSNFHKVPLKFFTLFTLLVIIGASLSACTDMKTEVATSQNANPNNSSSSQGATVNIF